MIGCCLHHRRAEGWRRRKQKNGWVIRFFLKNICRFFTFLSETSLSLFLHSPCPGSMHLHPPDLSACSCTLRDLQHRNHRLPGRDFYSMPFRNRGVCGQSEEKRRRTRGEQPGSVSCWVSEFVHKCILQDEGEVRCWDVGFKTEQHASSPESLSVFQMSERSLGAQRQAGEGQWVA